MRFPTYLFFILIFGECKPKTLSVQPLTDTRDTIVVLKDSLGSFKITIPTRYDTFVKWTQYSDCSSCGSERYRFQVKEMPIYMESGFFWDHLKDSIDQVTIIHQQDIHIRDSINSSFMKNFHEGFVGDMEAELWVPNGSSQFDTTLLVNDKWVSLFTAEHYDSSSHRYFKAVAGAMSIRGNAIKILFSLLTKKKDSITDKFIERSREMLMKIFAQNGI